MSAPSAQAPQPEQPRKLNAALAATLAGGLHGVMYALWFGGVIMIGALVAPAVSAVIHKPPAGLDPGLLKLTLTGGVIGQALRNFIVVTYLAGAVMILADLTELVIYAGPARRILTIARLGITVILLITAFYLGAVLTPRMDLMLAQRNMALFDTLHKQYENIVILYQTPLLLVIPFLTALRGTRRAEL